MQRRKKSSGENLRGIIIVEVVNKVTACRFEHPNYTICVLNVVLYDPWSCRAVFCCDLGLFRHVGACSVSLSAQALIFR